MNSANLTGRLVADPDVRYSNDNMCVAKFRLAVSRITGGTDYINFVAFGKVGELVEQYVGKGDLIGVSGRIQTGSYEAKDGRKVYTTDVVCASVDFLNLKKKEYAEAPSEDKGVPDGFDALDEDLPF